jgi:putative ABC transport system substrate-binding protein
MRRREFIAGLGGVAVWPTMAHAQQAAMPVIGYLSGFSPTGFPPYLAAFKQGLGGAGYEEGRNVVIEYRWAESQYDKLPALAADLVRRNVNVIVATGVTASPIAAKAATASIPVVFVTGGDPIKLGLVASLNQPGGNLTGATWLNNTMAAKRLELCRELAPAVATIGFLVNPGNPNAVEEMADVKMAARSLGLQFLVENASSEHEIEEAMAAFAQARVNLMFIAGDPFFTSRRGQLAALSARHTMPTCHPARPNVEAGGLMSYGANTTDVYRHIGIYTGRILKGEKPADLPVQQSAKFELVINLTTAKALGIVVPNKLLSLADEVIE